ncbi:MAG: deoxyribonuclease IV [Clostridiales bacterium]|nr:deoxyribonuclease IV [Clostridiales bacterium]
MLYLGYHLSSVNGFEAMGREAISAGANTFAFFTRNPRGGKAKDIDPSDAKALADLLKSEGFGKLVAHAPYTLNPCSDKEHVREFAAFCMGDDLKRMEHLPGNYYNFHPGSHVGQGSEKGILMIVDLLNEILTPEQTTTVLLETMAGKGSEVGGNFSEIAAIIDGVRLKDKVGVCMDSCHVSDAGYDIIGNLDGVLDEFDRIVGLDRLKALHINDSKNPPGSRKDRHEKIGDGHLGLDTLGRFINHPKLKGLPCILETPNDFDGYRREIEILRGWQPSE